MAPPKDQADIKNIQDKTGFPAQTAQSDMDILRRDYEDLKKAVGKLQTDAQRAGTRRLHNLQDTLVNAKDEQLAKWEDHVKEEPVKSLAIAFGAGILASFLLRR